MTGRHGQKGTYQKGTEEDEGNKIKIGEVAPTLNGIGIWVAGPVAQTRQHDLMPGFPSGTPENDRAVSTQRQKQRELCSEPRAWPAEPSGELQRGSLLFCVSADPGLQETFRLTANKKVPGVIYCTGSFLIPFVSKSESFLLESVYLSLASLLRWGVLKRMPPHCSQHPSRPRVKVAFALPFPSP